jgi:hypothetical protein
MTEGDAMPCLLLHKDAVFEDQIVYIDGNAYLGCDFRRCTVFYRGGVTTLGGPGPEEQNRMDSCIWHLDVIIHDHDQLQGFMQFLEQAVKRSLPTAPLLPPEDKPSDAKSG